MKETITQQVIALQTKSASELRDLWCSLFDTEPPPHGRKYLIPRLAYRLQELVYGPMPDKFVKKLDSLANRLEKGKPLPNPNATSKLLAGTKLIREYQGVMHEVLVSESGFIYQGQTYKSLSAIARKIAGTIWNGPAFFGLRNTKVKS